MPKDKGEDKENWHIYTYIYISDRYNSAIRKD